MAWSRKTAKICRARRAEQRLLDPQSHFFFGYRRRAVIFILAAQDRLRAQDFSLKTSFRP